MISFIIPTLNEEKAIEKTLKSISAFNGSKEIILSDGGSNDATLNIARKYTDLITVYEGAERQTISGGRNAGAKMARGEYLVFVDADVTIDGVDEFFTTAVGKFESDQDIVGLTTNLRVLPEAATFADRAIFGSFNFINRHLNNTLHVGGSFGEFQMMRRDVFNAIGGFKEHLVTGEDHDFFRRLARHGRTYFASELGVHHTGRRAHKVGWPRLLATWGANTVYSLIFRKSATKEWKVIR